MLVRRKMDEGYILSNKYRWAIFREIASGEKNIQRIAKKHHIIPIIAQRVITDFLENDIIKQNGNSYVFTDEGKRLLEKIGT